MPLPVVVLSGFNVCSTLRNGTISLSRDHILAVLGGFCEGRAVWRMCQIASSGGFMSTLQGCAADPVRAIRGSL